MSEVKELSQILGSIEDLKNKVQKLMVELFEAETDRDMALERARYLEQQIDLMKADG